MIDKARIREAINYATSMGVSIRETIRFSDWVRHQPADIPIAELFEQWYASGQPLLF